MNQQLPPKVQELITKISQARQIPQEELVKAYLDIYNSPFVQTDPSFVDDQSRIDYSLAVLWNRYMLRPPVREVEIVPIGISPPRLTKNGELMMNIFVLSSTSKKPIRLVLRGKEMVSRAKSIVLGAKYRVKVGQFATGDLIADERTVFDDPEGLDITLQQIMERLGVPEVPCLADLPKYPSKVEESGFVDPSDWRKVTGIILRANKGQRKDGTDYYVYTIADISLQPNEQGYVGVTVWVDETQFIYRPEDEVEVYGTVQVREDGDVSINGYLILPKHVRK
jgi:hypothetical protein